MATRGLHKPRVSAPNILKSVAGHLTERVRGPHQRTVRKIEINNDARGRMVDWTEVYDGLGTHDCLGEYPQSVKVGCKLPLGSGAEAGHASERWRKLKCRNQIQQVHVVGRRSISLGAGR